MLARIHQVAGTHLRYNQRQKMSGLKLLSSLPADCVALAFLDAQYRGVLDEMKFGNEGQSRQVGRSALPQMSDQMIADFVRDIARVLKPGCHLVFWTDKFTLAQGLHLRFFEDVDGLKIVDCIHWNKLRMGMGARARCQSEYAIIAQTAPYRAKGVWIDRGFKDAWSEQVERWRHPHAKPRGFTRRLIEAITVPGDLVLDPCAGSYGVLDMCQATGRAFIGCDLI